MTGGPLNTYLPRTAKNGRYTNSSLHGENVAQRPPPCHLKRSRARNNNSKLASEGYQAPWRSIRSHGLHEVYADNVILFDHRNRPERAAIAHSLAGRDRRGEAA